MRPRWSTPQRPCPSRPTSRAGGTRAPQTTRLRVADQCRRVCAQPVEHEARELPPLHHANTLRSLPRRRRRRLPDWHARHAQPLGRHARCHPAHGRRRVHSRHRPRLRTLARRVPLHGRVQSRVLVPLALHVDPAPLPTLASRAPNGAQLHQPARSRTPSSTTALPRTPRRCR
jgi:hypothetical protein